MMTLLVCLAALLPLQDSSEREIRELISRLGDDNPERRNESYRKLKERRQAALPFLKKATTEGDAETREHAARLVVVIGVMEKLPASLLQAAPGIEERLKPGGGETWTDAFVQLPGGKDVALRSSDLTALGIEAAKGATTPERRRAFVAAARSLNNPTVAAGLLELSRGGHEDGRREAVNALIDLNARTELLEVARPTQIMPTTAPNEKNREEEFRAVDEYVRGINLGHQAFSALHQMGATKELRIMLKDGKDRGFPGDAATALAEMGDTDSIPAIVALLPVLEGYERYKVARALGDLGARDAVPELSKLLDDPLGLPRAGALYAFGKLAAREQIPALIAHLLDKRSAVRVAAAQALEELAPAEARQPLLDALKDRDPSMRAVTALALGRIAGDGVAEALIARLEDDEIAVRLHAATALVRRGSWRGVPFLLRFAEKPTPISLNISAEGFGGGTATFINPLMELNGLRSPEAWKRIGSRRLSKDSSGILEPDLEQFAAEGSLTLELSRALAAEGKGLTERRYYWAPFRKGRSLESTLQYFCLSQQQLAFMVDGERLKLLSTAEAIQAWKRWYVEQAKADPAEQKDVARFAEELRRAAMTPEARKAIEDTEARDARQAHRAERLKAVGDRLTPALKAIPGAEDALLDGDDHSWTDLLLKTKPEGPLKGKDLDVLVVEGLRGAANAEEKAKATQAAALLKATGAVDELLGMLSEPEPAVRSAALTALGQLGGEREVPRIQAAGKDSHPGVKSAAAGALLQLKRAEAWPLYIELARHPMWEIREPAVRQIEWYGGPEHGELMVSMLQYATSTSNAADSGMRYLARHGAREYIPDLIKAYQVKDSRCARTAQESLVRLGAREAIPAFVSSFQAGNSSVAPDLAQWGVRDILPELRRRVSDKETRDLRSVVVALGIFGDRESAPALEKLMLDKELFVQREAAEALVRIEGPNARAKIVAAPNPHGELDEALAAVGAREAIPAMIARLDKWCRDILIAALVDLGATEALPKIFETLSTPDGSYNYYNALRSVARKYPRESMPTCRLFIQKCTHTNREMAASLLCEAGSREALGVLFDLPESSPISLNALRNPEAWERISKRTLAGTRFASRREIAIEVAREAGLEFVDLPATSTSYKAWIGYHQVVGNPYRPASLLERLESVQDRGWGIVLEGKTLKILPGDEAAKLWRDWWAVEKPR